MKSAEVDEKFSYMKKQKPTYNYKPSVYCDCEEKAPRWMSWTKKNPGRRFYTCRRSKQDGGCDFFEFAEERFPERACAVISGLCDTEKEQDEVIQELRSTIKQMKTRDSAFNDMADEVLCLKDEKDRLGQSLRKEEDKEGTFGVLRSVHSKLLKEKIRIENSIIQFRMESRKLDDKLSLLAVKRGEVDPEEEGCREAMLQFGISIEHLQVLINQLHSKIARSDVELRGIRVSLKEVQQCGEAVALIPSL